MGAWVSPEATASILASDGRVQLLVRTQADETLVASGVRAFAQELGQYAEEGGGEVLRSAMAPGGFRSGCWSRSPAARPQWSG